MSQSELTLDEIKNLKDFVSEEARQVVLEAVAAGEAKVLVVDGVPTLNDPYYSERLIPVSSLRYNSEIGLHDV